MAAPRLMTIPAELRIKIWRHTIPDELVLPICPPSSSHKRPPHESPTYETRQNPVLPLLLLNKTINAEAFGAVSQPELVVTFKDIYCLNYWLSDGRARKYLSHFRSFKIAFPPYLVPEELHGMDDATHRSEMEKDAIDTIEGEAPFLVLVRSEWTKEVKHRVWTLELKFDMPKSTNRN